MKHLSVVNGIVIDVWATAAIIEEILVNTGLVTNNKYTRAYQGNVSGVLFFGREGGVGQRHTHVPFSNTYIILFNYTIGIRSKIIIIVMIVIVIVIIIGHHH